MTDEHRDQPTSPATATATGALAIGSDVLSGAVLIGFAGALAEFGHDGLYLVLGLAGGLALAGALLVPHLRRAGLSGPVALLDARFGLAARLAAAAVLMAAVGVLLAAELAAASISLSVLSGLDRPWSLAVTALAVLLAVLLASRRGLTLLQAALFPLIAATLALPVMLPALAAAGVPLPQLTFGTTLQAISALELALLEQELADPVSLKTYLRPFTTMTPTGGVMLTLSLALGLASLPRLLGRPAASASVHGARLTIALAAVLVLVAALALPPVAAALRHGVLTSLVGSDPAALPAWLVDLGRLGLVKVCGVAATSTDAVTAACAALPDSPARLRLYDIELTPAAALFALPGLTGLPQAVTWTLAAALAVAAFAAAAWLLVTLAAELAPARRPDGHSPAAACGRSVPFGARALAALLVPAAAYWAATDPADLAEMVAWALALASAGLAPALLGAIWWSRATPAGAVMAIVTGFAVTAYYIVATRYFAAGFYETWGAFSNAGFGAIADYEAARDALAAAADEDRAAALAGLEAEARRVANWWGIRPAAAGALGAATGLAVLVIASAVTPRSSPAQREVLARIRGGHFEHAQHVRRWRWRRRG